MRVHIAVEDRPIEVAYVDDSDSDQLLASVALADTGESYSLVVAESAVELYALFRRRIERGEPLPDVVVIDLKMPRVNGHQLIKQLVADTDLGDLPLVVLSTSSDPHDIEEARRSGVVRYEVKPASFAELVDVFGRIVAEGRSAR